MWAKSEMRAKNCAKQNVVKITEEGRERETETENDRKAPSDTKK